jgi:cytochrome c
MVRTIATAAFAAILLSTSALAAGDAGRGEKAFHVCAMCHSVAKGMRSTMGPNLFAVTGRKAGSLETFSYSPALKNSGIVWSDDKLKAWLTNPQKLVPGTRMIMSGVSSSGDIDDIIAYLHTQK